MTGHYREESPDVRKKQTSSARHGTEDQDGVILLAEIESRFMSSKILLMQAKSRGNGLFSCFLLRGKLSSDESLYLFPAAPTPPNSALGAAEWFTN